MRDLLMLLIERRACNTGTVCTTFRRYCGCIQKAHVVPSRLELLRLNAILTITYSSADVHPLHEAKQTRAVLADDMLGGKTMCHIVCRQQASRTEEMHTSATHTQLTYMYIRAAHPGRMIITIQ